MRLVAMLPAGAAQCTVLRPGSVNASQRNWMGMVSSGSRFAWNASEHADVVIEARQYSRTGPGASVRLIRFAGDWETFRRTLDEHPEVTLGWDLPPTECRPDACLHSARRVAHDVVRLEMGLWRERAPGAEQVCHELAQAHPDALELSARQASEAEFGDRDVFQWSTTRVQAGRRLLRLSVRDPLISTEVLRMGVAARSWFPLPAIVGAQRSAPRQEGDTIVRTVDFTWDDLRLAVDDRVREQRNHRHAELLSRLEHEVAVDLRQLSHAQQQVELRLSLLDNPPASAALVNETVSLAERLLAAHPTDADCAHLVALVHHRHSGDRERVRALIQAFAARDPLAARWRELGWDGEALSGIAPP